MFCKWSIELIPVIIYKSEVKFCPFCVCVYRLSGLSPFMGETDVETMANVTVAQYDFDDEAFDSISNDAKDFIKKLLVKDHKYVYL